MNDPAQIENDLLAAVKALSEHVSNLTKLLHDEYPRRSEIQDTYPTKADVKKKRLRIFALGMVILLISQFVTVSMISYCFLGDPREEQHQVCKLIPGYTDSVELNQSRLESFEDLVNFIEENRDKLENSDEQIEALKLRIAELEDRQATRGGPP
jgi:hypothetical protein